MSRETGSRWRIGAMIAIAILAVGVVASLVWPRGDGAPERDLPTGPAPPCPFGYVDHTGRGELLRARLAETQEGAQILDALGETEVRYCFGDIEVPVVSSDRILLLTSRGDDTVLTARLGHLLHHVLHGPPVPDELPRDERCEAIVERALRAEARAYAVELRLRRELALTEPLYEFEDAYWRSDDGERTIFDYLVAHPEGGPGLDPLGNAYRERCENARR